MYSPKAQRKLEQKRQMEIKQRRENTQKLAKEIIPLLQIEKGKLENLEELKRELYSLRGFITSSGADKEHPDYNRYKDNTIEVVADDGFTYTFFAFSGSKYGGSEREDTEELHMKCKDRKLDVCLYKTCTYSR